MIHGGRIRLRRDHARVNGLRWGLILHARIFQLICPFSTGSGMTVLQMLTEVVCAEEFLVDVALSKFVHDVEMLNALVPIRWVVELAPTISASIGGSGWRILSVVCDRHHRGGRGWMERHIETGEGSTRPRMTAKVQGVLMALGLILILEAICAVYTLVLFLSFVCS